MDRLRKIRAPEGPPPPGRQAAPGGAARTRPARSVRIGSGAHVASPCAPSSNSSTTQPSSSSEDESSAVCPRARPALERVARAALECSATRAVILHGPRKEARRVATALTTPSQRQRWLARAKVSALAQIAPTTARSLRSGLRTWRAFVDGICPECAGEMPPRLGPLVAWSNVLSNCGTYTNYLGHLRRACLMQNKDVAVFGHPAIKEAKAGLRRRRRRPRRTPRFIQRVILERISAAVDSGDVPVADFMLMLMSYTFMLRVPSEAVGAMYSGERFDANAAASVIVDGARVGVQLARRKNWQQGAPPLFLSCWCSGSPRTCPVHVLAPWLQNLGAGSRLFPHLRPDQAVARVRRALTACGIADADAYGTHDLRRGHALDRVKNGDRLNEILRMGQWRGASSLVKSYLPASELEAASILEAVVAQSSSDDEREGTALRRRRQGTQKRAHSRRGAASAADLHV